MKRKKEKMKLIQMGFYNNEKKKKRNKKRA
jgi:hypothetical protein